MKRLTKDNDVDSYELKETAELNGYNVLWEVKSINNAIQKLGQLEDIEDELGIDLITLFKAYTNGFYVKGEEEKQYIDFENSLNAIAFKNKEMFYGHKRTYQYVKLYDYGKTWALTKEELEK